MLKINRRTDYAVRVILALAKRPAGTRCSSHQIQQEMLVPRAFLNRIIADLARKGLINTFPGPKGGVQLARPAEAVSLRDVYEAIEGPLLVSDCLRSGACPFDETCPVHRFWGRLQSTLVKSLEETTLQQLVHEAAEATQQT